MAFTPYDWNQAVQQRMDYIEERLRDGSPVVALSLPDGVLMVTVHRTQRKLFEIYDRLMFGGIGNQSDLEAARMAAIDFAHREGYQRSPDDVTAHRLVGSVLSPAIKRAFADPFSAPFVFRGLFAELGDFPAADQFFTLNYDGEFRRETLYAVAAGASEAENRMLALLHAHVDQATRREAALRLALEAWAVGRLHARRAPDDEEAARPSDAAAVLQDALATGTLEAALLERHSRRESRFRLLARAELEPAVADYRRGAE
ncbi:MAG: 20S proteasome subunit A/B [Armatimonadetes bacterium]|nr:20S proteasome subunit A/B [Armatimonadota bacterium]